MEPLSASNEEHLKTLGPQWTIQDGKLRREITFPDYPATIRFVDKVAELAERADHHPDLHVFYKRLVIELWTHDVGGVSDKDISLAAQINRLLEKESGSA